MPEAIVDTVRPPRWRDLFAFVNALRHQVVALVTGGAITAALAVAQGFGWQVKPSLYGIALATFFLIASFGAWFEKTSESELLRNRYVQLVPSIVISFRIGEEEQDEETGEFYSPEFLSFTNVGREAATNVSFRTFEIAGRKITVSEVPVLISNGPAVDVRVFGLRSALWQARKKMPRLARVAPLPIRVKLTLDGGTCYQHEGLQWEYALTELPYGNINIKRVTVGSHQEWTDFEGE